MLDQNSCPRRSPRAPHHGDRIVELVGVGVPARRRTASSTPTSSGRSRARSDLEHVQIPDDGPGSAELGRRPGPASRLEALSCSGLGPLPRCAAGSIGYSRPLLGPGQGPALELPRVVDGNDHGNSLGLSHPGISVRGPHDSHRLRFDLVKPGGHRAQHVRVGHACPTPARVRLPGATSQHRLEPETPGDHTQPSSQRTRDS
jgi:hypothetical protein